MQRATCMQHTTDNVAKTACNGLQTTRQQTTGGLRHAGNTAQKTESNRQRMQQTTCIRQQTACRRTRAHARCNRKHTALPHFVCGGQRAAGNQQHARSILYATTSAQHGTDATHQMQHTTGAAACSKHKWNRQHAAGNAMHGMRDETKGGRTLAHLDVASGSLRRPSGVEVG